MVTSSQRPHLLLPYFASLFLCSVTTFPLFPHLFFFTLLLCHLTPFSHLSFFSPSSSSCPFISLLPLSHFMSSLSPLFSLSLPPPLHPQSHVAGCEFAGVSCPNTGCHEMVLAIQLQPHLAQCLYRLVTCSHCQEKLVAKDLEVGKE